MKSILRGLLFLVVSVLFEGNLMAQDHIFLREDDQVIDCIIISASDSVIVFRVLDLNDTHEYEISTADIYGFLLDDPQREQLKSVDYQMEFFHPTIKRKPIFRIRNTLLFRLQGDTAAMPSKGKITDISCDSVQLERKINRKTERFYYGWNEFHSFGYTTLYTEVFTLILAPVDALQSGSFFFYRKLEPESGWKRKCAEAPDEVSKLILKKYPTRGKKIRLPQYVKRKSKRNQPE
jgi:hypothetical protein